MKSSSDQPTKSRKKPAPQSADEKTTSFMHSPNLKYQFLTSHAGSALKQLRSQEISQIVNFFIGNCKQSNQQRNEKEQSKIVICVGSPGTGKTSVIRQAITEFENQIKKITKANLCVNLVRFIFLNANSFKKIDEINKQIEKVQSNNPAAKLISKMVTLSKDQNLVLNVIFIEQIEKIVQGNNQAALSQFFLLEDKISNVQKTEKTEKKVKKAKNQFRQKYMIIGTSNSINVDQMLKKKVSQVLKINIRVFKPYSVQSKLKILRGRIQQTKQRLGIQLKIQDKLIKFIIMKLLENKKDDTRSLIDVVKQLILIAEQNKEVIQQLQNGQTATFEISLETLQSNEKVKGMLVDSKVELISKLNFKQQLVLCIIYKYLKENEAIDIMYTQMILQFKKVQKQMGLSSQQDIGIVVEQLETYGCVQLKNKSALKIMSKNEKTSAKISIILKISGRDIENALSKNLLLSKLFESK